MYIIHSVIEIYEISNGTTTITSYKKKQYPGFQDISLIYQIDGKVIFVARNKWRQTQKNANLGKC